MGLAGSVFSGALTAGNHQISLPQSGLTIVGVALDGPFITVPLDSSRNAILPNSVSGGSGNVVTFVGPMRRVHWKVNGQTLNFATPGTSAGVFFYYGTPLEGSKPLESFAGVYGSTTLAAGAGTVQLVFPKGPLRLTGFTVVDQTTKNAGMTTSWSTSSGQSLTVQRFGSEASNFMDIVPLDLEAAINLTVSITNGNGTDVVYVIAYYV
jgi:hypothetical protein